MLIKTNLETLEMMARTTPDILIDFIQTENILGEKWRIVAITVAVRRLNPERVLPMLVAMVSHQSPNVRESVVKHLFKFWTLEEISGHLTWSRKQRI